VVVALAIIGAVLVFLKRRRTQDEYYSPSSSPAGFGNFKEPFGVRPPEPAYGAGVVAVDQRLNPVMLGERRISEGSLADARDYSRKILRVANPDDDA
jgi:cell wall integrity and stress response component